jgi:tryptophan-rich sensory protein
MVRSVALTLAVCAVAALLEGLMAGRGVRQRFAQLRRPPLSPSLTVWGAIGVAYYLIYGVVLYRLLLLPSTGLRVAALSLTLIVLLANAFWNYLFFRVQNLGQSLALSAGYSLAAVVLLGLLMQVDRVAAWCLSAYVGYLPYANWWGYAVWRANTCTAVDKIGY